MAGEARVVHATVLANSRHPLQVVLQALEAGALPCAP